MSPSEKSVRKQEIDRALQVAGWRVVNYARWSKGDRTATDAIEKAVHVAQQRADAKPVDQAILARTFREELLGSTHVSILWADTQVCPDA